MSGGVLGEVLHEIAVVLAPSVRAGDLLTCTHVSGASVYTRSPEVLGTDFKCPAPAPKKGFVELPPDSKLDPTPTARQASVHCPSTTTLKINSSDYTGSFKVELRKGNRPGSVRISGGLVSDGGEVQFPNVCRGNYFFAFGPSDSDIVSVTRYFPVVNHDGSYSNPVITVTYSRANLSTGQRVEKTRKQDL